MFVGSVKLRRIALVVSLVLLCLPATAWATTIYRPQAESQIRRAIRYDCHNQRHSCKRWQASHCTLDSRLKVHCAAEEEFAVRGKTVSTCYFRMSILLNRRGTEYHFHESRAHCYRPNGSLIE